MKNNGLFPQGLATGTAFFNRNKEREQLKSCFLNNEHVVIIAPRRYGKSSLIKKALVDAKVPGRRIDLLPATNLFFVNKAIKACVSELLNEIAPKTKLARQKLLDFIKELHPKLTLSLLGQHLEISTSQAPETSIVDLLVSLNTAAEKLKKRVVVCFDEFQQVGLLKNFHSIEASIRHAAESSSHVTYVFSGSSRHLLSLMFNTKSRPLYHLCDVLRLERIDKETYTEVLLAEANKHWQTATDKKAIEELLNLTECHTYYVNALCRLLWKESKKPTVAAVQKTWLNYINVQAPWIADDLSRLTPNQRNILAGIAYNNITEPLSQEFTQKVKISASSIKKSLGILVRDDFVYQDAKGEYKVLDPAIHSYLLKIKFFDFLDE